MKRYLLVALALLVTSCAKSPTLRNPASGLTPPSLSGNGDGLMHSAEVIDSQVRSADFNVTNCVDYLVALQSEIQQLRPWQFDSHAPANYQELTWKLWQIRTDLHDRLPSLNVTCVKEIRNTFRLLRFAEDYLLEQSRGVVGVDPASIDYSHVAVPLAATPPEYVYYSRDGRSLPVEFKNGDVVISRGLTFLSAMISRMGDIESQFSHVIFVHVDEQTRVPETIESYVGVGVKTYDLQTAMRNENARLLILRAKDQDLARRASDRMYTEVKKRVAEGHPIPYDYKLDFHDHTAMSCAEVAEAAFWDASNAEFTIPYYPSRLQSAPALIHRLGMDTGVTFEPGDMEVDPRFDIVGEWRDLRVTRDSRQKDVILSSLISWMDEYGYDLIDSTHSRVANHVIWPMRRTFMWPLVQKVLHVPDFSAQIPHGMFHTIVLINQVGDVLYKELRERDQAFMAAHGWPMTYRELYDALEEFRKTDLALYSNPHTRRHAQFHQFLHSVRR